MVELTQQGSREERHPGFTCFKTYRPIRYDRRWFRLALVKAALDPEILRMGPSPVARDNLPPTAEFAFWVATRNSSRLIILTSGYLNSRAISARMPVQIQYRSDLSTGNAQAFAKAVWSCKRRPITAIEHVSVAAVARVNPDGATLGFFMDQLVATVGCALAEAIEVVFAMVANGYLVTDISMGLGPDVTIRPGPMLKQGTFLPADKTPISGVQLSLFPEALPRTRNRLNFIEFG